jgi:hypothetical protein
MVRAKSDFDMISTQGIIIRELDVVRVQTPAIARVLVMLNDDFTIEIVHIHSCHCEGRGVERRDPEVISSLDFA